MSFELIVLLIMLIGGIVLVIGIYIMIVRFIYRINDQIELLEEIRDEIRKITSSAEKPEVRTESRTLGSGQM